MPEAVGELPRRSGTPLDGPRLLEPPVHADERGFLQETYRADAWAAQGVAESFVQDNHSRSRRGTLRGLHYQLPPGQAKLVRCARGAIFDVVVDLRRDSPTFGRWEGHVLDDEGLRQLYVPAGFAHGFCVVSEVADVLYKLSTYYDPGSEREIAYDDPEIGVEWPDLEPIVSERDARAPTLREVADDLGF